MIKYSEYMELTNEMEDRISLLMFLSENSQTINESNLSRMSERQVAEGVNDWLNKVGMKLHKGDGIIDYLRGFTKGAGKLIMAAIKKDKEEVKRIAGTLDKAKVVDFLLKLDMATMHIVTGPIRFIDAVTGWDLMANLKHVAVKAVDMLKIFYDAINKVKSSINHVLSGDKQKSMLKIADNLAYNMPDPS